MADPVTSKINKVPIGKGKDKKEVFTATKVTPTTDAKGNRTYVMEVVQYDNAKGEGGRIIGTRNGNEITYNENAGDDVKSADARKEINKNSKKQATSVRDNITTKASDDRAFNTANDKGNEGTEYENDQAAAKLKNAAAEGTGTPKPGTRNDGFGNYVFPQTLRKEVANGQDFLKINMMKYEPRGDFNKENFTFSERDTDRKSIGSVILPIPGGIQDGQSCQWGGSTMTPLDMAKADIALAGVTKGIGAAVGAAGDAAEKMAAGFGDNKKGIAAVIAGMAAGAGNLLTRTTGAITNPNMELLFGGPELRTFSFQFTLAPRSKPEAMEVIKIIRFFKQGMAPIRTKSMLFLKSPHTFKLSYKGSDGDDHKYLNKFKECALGSFGVNYTPNGNYSTYEGGVMTCLLYTSPSPRD